MSLSLYDYDLPVPLIAQEPLPDRSDSRLLVVDRKSQSFQHCCIRDLPQFLKPNDCLVLNNSKVIPARLIGHRTATGGRWEGLFIQSISPNYWQVIGKTKGKILPGETVKLSPPDNTAYETIRFVRQLEDHSWQVQPLDSHQPAADILERIGLTPIPPYIRKGKPLSYDKERYQTVYADQPGSVAAPTAGLHFTPGLLDTLNQQGVRQTSVTLHVGLGTFKPITAEKIKTHQMHSEWCSLSSESACELNRCRRTGGRIIAVGTTSVRVLESASQTMESFKGSTSLFIYPPYKFKNVDVLLTNFHFPRSTLLILVRTFGGEELISEAYRIAIEQKYRFFSYGDAMLIL